MLFRPSAFVREPFSRAFALGLVDENPHRGECGLEPGLGFEPLHPPGRLIVCACGVLLAELQLCGRLARSRNPEERSNKGSISSLVPGGGLEPPRPVKACGF